MDACVFAEIKNDLATPDFKALGSWCACDKALEPLIHKGPSGLT